MADDFDTSRAKRELRDVLERVQAVRNILTNDVINYNWEKQPRSEAEADRINADMRKYLREAYDRLDAILSRL